MKVGIGDKAPEFELEAVVSGRKVGLPANFGRNLILIFHDHMSTHVVEPVQSAVRNNRYPAEVALIASVVNLRSVPKMMRSMVTKIVEKAYNDASKLVPEGMDPADYIIILLDWNGKVTQKYGVGKAPSAVVIDEEGDIVSYQRGGDLPQSILEILPHIAQPRSES